MLSSGSLAPRPPAAQRPYRLAHEVGEGAREARVGQGWGVTDPKGPQGGEAAREAGG